MILASKMQCLKVFLSINDDDNQEKEEIKARGFFVIM